MGNGCCSKSNKSAKRAENNSKPLSDIPNIPKVGDQAIDGEKNKHKTIIDKETSYLKVTGQSGADSKASKTTHAKAIIDAELNARSNAKIEAHESGEPLTKLKIRD